MASEFDGIITQAMIDAAVRKVLEKYAPRIENILRRHIWTDIESVTIPTATGGPWYFSGSSWSAINSGAPYSKRHVLAGAIEHKIQGNTLLVSSTASSDPSVISGATIGGWGGYLEFFEVGNQGFKGFFRRPAVTNAQKEADALIPQMEEEAIRMLEASL